MSNYCALADAEQLLDLGHHIAAGMTVRVALEKSLVDAVKRIGKTPPQKTLASVATLRHTKCIDRKKSRRINKLCATANAIAHGENASSEQVAQLIEDIRIACGWLADFEYVEPDDDAALSFARFFRDTYKPLRLMGRSPATVEDYTACLDVWQRVCGEPVDTVELLDVVRFLERLAESRAPATVNKYRRYLLAILRLAKRQKITKADWIDDVPKVPETRDEPQAYTIDDVGKLLAAARQEPGDVCGIPACDWWPALILTIYDTGVRVSAGMSIKSADVDLASSTVRVLGMSQKNKKGRVYRVSRQTAEALAAIHDGDRELLFPWPWDQGCRQWQYLTKAFRRVIEAAELPQPRDPFHKLRRTCASYCEAHGISAQHQLGHSSPQTTRAYLDPRIVRSRQAADVLPRPEQEEDTTPQPAPNPFVFEATANPGDII